MSDAAIYYSPPKSKRGRYILSASAGCPRAYDLTSETEHVGANAVGDSENLSYLYALGFHWLLYVVASPTPGVDDDVYVLKTDGATTNIYLVTSAPFVRDGKLVSDGTSVWAGLVLTREVSNPYRIVYADDCADFIHFARSENDAATWSPDCVEVYYSSGTTFALLDTVEARFNNTGGGAFGGDLNGMSGEIEGCASEEDPGVAYFTWSEAGYTGTMIRSATAEGGRSGLVSGCPSDCVPTDFCGQLGPDEDPTRITYYLDPGGNRHCVDDNLRLDDGCCCATISSYPSHVLPTFPGSTFPGPEGDDYPVYVGDWSWFGMRFVTSVWSTSAKTAELEPIGYMKSVATISYGDQYYDDAQIFSPTCIAPSGVSRDISDGTPLAFIAFPSASNHSLSDFVSGTEVWLMDITDATVIDTLTVGDAIPTAGRTIDSLAHTADQTNSIYASVVPWTDPADNQDVFYLGSTWRQDNGSFVLNVHRVPTGGGAFQPFDLDATQAFTSTAAVRTGTIMPETFNTWVFGLGFSQGHRYERNCPQGWLGESTGSPTSDTTEFALVNDVIIGSDIAPEDAIYYGSQGLVSPVSHGVWRLCICRICYPCPGEYLPILVESGFENGESVTQGAAARDWSVRTCTDSIVEVLFTADTFSDCLAVTPVDGVFYYCDTPPGTIDISTLTPGFYDFCWEGFDACGASIWLDCATLHVLAPPTKWPRLHVLVDGHEIANVNISSSNVANVSAIRVGAYLSGDVNEHQIDNVKVGPTLHSGSLFNADFATTDVPPFDSQTGSGISVSGGQLVISNAGSDAYDDFSSPPWAVGSYPELYLEFQVTLDASMFDGQLTADFMDFSINGNGPGSPFNGIYVQTSDSTWQLDGPGTTDGTTATDSHQYTIVFHLSQT